MVSNTFLNLKEEKKQRIIEAALAEFSRVTMNEASVTNIVKKAAISRGSFYQYFEDKEDLYQYLVSDLYAKHRKDLYETIKENSGDLYQSLLDFYRAYIDEIMSSEYFSFYENTFLHVNHYLIGSQGLLSLSNRS
ncbi:MAG: TetR/AcrR family transcriptional regulator, partial [Atopostipes suicloacalis]|nr:TetR/AcrR family transcriptional regulator [Atopostipes suicloacalis]